MIDKTYTRSLEERIEILENIVYAILHYDFPDDNGLYRDHFNLYANFMHNPYKEDENTRNAVDQLEYIIIRRNKERDRQ